MLIFRGENMSIKYETKGWIKFYEADNYEDGCDPNTMAQTVGRDSFSADTIEGVLKQIVNFTGCSRANLDIQPMGCDELGRVEAWVMENGEGDTPCEREYEDWKRGEIKLWACVYSFKVERVERAEVNLLED